MMTNPTAAPREKASAPPMTINPVKMIAKIRIPVER
jgi:hypothetical protein